MNLLEKQRQRQAELDEQQRQRHKAYEDEQAAKYEQHQADETAKHEQRRREIADIYSRGSMSRDEVRESQSAYMKQETRHRVGRLVIFAVVLILANALALAILYVLRALGVVPN